MWGCSATTRHGQRPDRLTQGDQLCGGWGRGEGRGHRGGRCPWCAPYRIWHWHRALVAPVARPSPGQAPQVVEISHCEQHPDSTATTIRPVRLYESGEVRPSRLYSRSPPRITPIESGYPHHYVASSESGGGTVTRRQPSATLGVVA